MEFFAVPFRPIELLQSSGQLQPVKQAFTGFTNPENVLGVLQAPEFRLLAVGVGAIVCITLALHGWAWLKMLLEPEEALPASHQNVQLPPSENYVPKALLWQSSRTGFAPEYGLIGHKLDEPAPSRGEAVPTRGGDLPSKPAA